MLKAPQTIQGQVAGMCESIRHMSPSVQRQSICGEEIVHLFHFMQNNHTIFILGPLFEMTVFWQVFTSDAVATRQDRTAFTGRP